jgi:hypothetical protein
MLARLWFVMSVLWVGLCSISAITEQRTMHPEEIVFVFGPVAAGPVFSWLVRWIVRG